MAIKGVERIHIELDLDVQLGKRDSRIKDFFSYLDVSGLSITQRAMVRNVRITGRKEDISTCFKPKNGRGRKQKPNNRQ